MKYLRISCMGKRVVVREGDVSVTSLATTPFYSRACICKCLRSPGIDYKESIPRNVDGRPIGQIGLSTGPPDWESISWAP
jgi:hypothetical protein